LIKIGAKVRIKLWTQKGNEINFEFNFNRIRIPRVFTGNLPVSLK